MTRARQLREHDAKELLQRLAESRKELFNLRFQLATGRLDNISRLGELRREIARLITVLSETEDRHKDKESPTRRRGSKSTMEES